MEGVTSTMKGYRYTSTRDAILLLVFSFGDNTTVLCKNRGYFLTNESASNFYIEAFIYTFIGSHLE